MYTLHIIQKSDDQATIQLNHLDSLASQGMPTGILLAVSAPENGLRSIGAANGEVLVEGVLLHSNKPLDLRDGR